jgi:hypothetical protein
MHEENGGRFISSMKKSVVMSTCFETPWVKVQCRNFVSQMEFYVV